MKKRKAQITVFIIIGIAIAVIIATTIYLGKAKIEADLSKEYFSSAGIKPELNNIQESIINCIDITTQEALVIIGIQGGYYNKPEKYFDLGWAFIPYYYYEGIIILPNKKLIESELESYVDNNFNFCIKELNTGDFKLKFKEPNTNVKIEKSSAIFNINLQITIEKEDNKIKFQTKDHEIRQPSKLFEIIEIADYITNSHKEDPDLICINCVAELAKERQIYVDMLEFDETTTQIIILENETSTEPYIFEFLNKYVPIN